MAQGRSRRGGTVVVALVVVGWAWLTSVSAMPRNVILLIGDGMGPGQIRAASLYKYGAAGRLTFESFPHQGEVTTASATSAVTDSAAAATAIATGVKVANGVVSMAIPGDGAELQTLLEYAQELGKATGLVTTAYITDATPAAFAAHESDRANTTEIAADYLNQTRPNVLLGGGGNGMTPTDASEAGYTVVTDRAGLLGLNTETETFVSGQFGTGDLPYEYDGLGALPHLSEMTDVALRILDNDPDGFLLVVEGARIDDACHANDLPRMLAEMDEFEAAVNVVLSWAGMRDDTLIVVTGDHETGGLGVISAGGQGDLPEVTWSGTGHTGANVTFYALGPGAEKLCGIVDNTVFFGVVVGPRVELVTPPDGSVIDATTVTFSCRVADDSGLVSAELLVRNAATTVLTFSGPTQTEDAQIEADNPDANFGADTYTAINVDGQTPHAHAVMRFPNLIGTGPGQVPPGAVICAATLEINCFNPGNVMNLYRLTEEWVESEVTWNERRAGVPWSSPGADGTGSHAGTALSADCTATGWRSFDITAFVQEWADGAPNYGLVFTDTGTDGVDFDSSESTNPPVLTVEFVSDWQALDTQELSGTSATVTFAPQSLAHGEEYVWNCVVTNAIGEKSPAPADARFLVDTTTSAPDQPELVGPTDGAKGVSLSPALAVTVTDPESEPMSVTFYGRDGKEADEFCIIALPDTQHYSESYPEIFTAQTQWIAANVAALNIVFVTHEGDIVQNYDQVPQEWDNADASMSVLDGVVPYGMCPGNHDIPTTLFNQYFPYTRYESEPWYGGHYPSDSNDNNYQLFSAGGDNYIIIHIRYGPDSNVLAWADGVLKAHADHRAIITTHSYLDGNGNRTAEGAAIWDNVVVPNENVFLVLCGHVSAEAVRTDMVGGRVVHQVLADYQDRANGGDGWLRILRFAPAEGLVHVETYSPWRDEYETDADSCFTLEVPMTGAWAIGTQSGVASGKMASVIWPNLAPGIEHSWFVRITDASGNTQVGPVWRFTTGTDDTTPPAISNVAAVDITDTTARITWNTDEPADSLVEYGPTTSYGSTEADGAFVTAHSVVLTGLSQGTTYHYRVTSADSSGNSSSSGDFTFTTDRAPVADDDAYTATEDTTLEVAAPGVLSNDSDADNDPLTAVLVTGPENGTLVLNEDGSFTYTPAADFSGTDTFTYQASDGSADSNIATVTITVYPGADAPSAPANLTATAGDRTVSLTWEASVDVDGDLAGYNIYRATTPGGQDFASPVGFVAAPATTYDDTGLTNDVTYYYVVKAVDAAGFESLPSNEAAATPNNTQYDAYAQTDPLVTYGALSGDGVAGTYASGDGLTQIIGEGPNGKAGAASLQAEYTLVTTAAPDSVTGLTLYLEASWTAADAGDPLVVSLWNETTGAWEDITAAIADGSFTPAGDPRQYVSATGAIRVLFTDTEAVRKETKDQLTIDLLYAHIGVGTPNEAPVAAGDSYATDEDTVLTVSAPGVLENDTDAERDPLTAVLVSGPSNGTLELNADGSFTYTPDADFNGTDTFTYRASDGGSLSNSAVVTVTVDPVNDPPVAIPDAYTVSVDTTLAVPAPGVLANDTDADGDSLTAVLVTSTANGSLALATDGSFTYTPAAGFVGEDSFTYVANDGPADSAPVTVTITVSDLETTVSVAAIDMELVKAGKNTKAQATVTLQPVVNGATVTGDWLFNGEVIDAGASAVTDEAGVASLNSPPKRAASGDTFTFRVTDVAAGGYTYDPGANVEIEDSITVP